MTQTPSRQAHRPCRPMYSREGDISKWPGATLLNGRVGSRRSATRAGDRTASGRGVPRRAEPDRRAGAGAKAAFLLRARREASEHVAAVPESVRSQLRLKVACGSGQSALNSPLAPVAPDSRHSQLVSWVDFCRCSGFRNSRSSGQPVGVDNAASAGQGEDFLAVIDADPASPSYGKLVASAASGIRTHQVHHTEYWMPEDGLLFANDHKAGKTVIMDLRDPLHPRAHATFGDLDGFSHPHSFLRLPNGHVLASFQVEGHMSHGDDMAATMAVWRRRPVCTAGWWKSTTRVGRCARPPPPIRRALMTC